jgi:diacylglycerol kinase (ATP)
VIVNPAAAGGRLGREWTRLEPALAEHGLRAPVWRTEAPGHATELAARAVREGAGLVVVAGGDGTVCEAAEGLHRAARGELAILPLGTGNDAARTLGVPVRFEDAVRAAVAGRTRRVDLIAVGGRVVLNAIGIGLTADINQRAARVKWIRGIAVYAATAAVSLFAYEPPVVRVAADGVEYEGPMTMLAVHNGPTTGGGFRLTPAADPADGLLDACLVGEASAMGRLARLVGALRGTLGGMRGSLEAASPSLTLEFARPLPVHFDGNQAELAPPVATFQVLPLALAVRTAASSGRGPGSGVD